MVFFPKFFFFSLQHHKIGISFKIRIKCFKTSHSQKLFSALVCSGGRTQGGGFPFQDVQDGAACTEATCFREKSAGDANINLLFNVNREWRVASVLTVLCFPFSLFIVENFKHAEVGEQYMVLCVGP